MKRTFVHFGAALFLTISVIVSGQCDLAINKGNVLDLTITEEFTEKEYCPIHKEKLQADIVPTTGGLSIVPHYYNHSKLFPYANKKYDLGCVANPNVKAVKILYCQQCRQTETWWSIKRLIGLV